MISSHSESSDELELEHEVLSKHCLDKGYPTVLLEKEKPEWQSDEEGDSSGEAIRRAAILLALVFPNVDA